MCGRYSLSTPLSHVAEMFGATADIEDPGPRFNLAPTETVPVVRETEAGRRIVGSRWGLIPGWTEDPSSIPLIINARSESLEARPAFRERLADGRCIVPADGFYEWRTEGRTKQPYFVRRRDGRPMALAALWDLWRPATPGPDPTLSCAILTTDANDLLEPLHDRMPVILDERRCDRWLEPGFAGFERLRESLRPFASDELEAFAVSTRVNRVGNDDASCVEPIDPSGEGSGSSLTPPRGRGAEETTGQLGLFEDAH